MTITGGGTDWKLTGTVRKLTNVLLSIPLTSVGWHSCAWICVWMWDMYMYDDYGCVCKHFCYYVIFVRRRFFRYKNKELFVIFQSIVYTYYDGLDILGWPFKLSIATFVTILEFCTFARKRHVWNSLIYFFKRFTICSTIRGFSELWIFLCFFFQKPWDLS